MKVKKRKLVIFVLSAIFVLVGCSIRQNIVRDLTKYNLAIGEAKNKMLLMNIIRASKNHPMLFTGIMEMTGGLTYEIGTGNISIPFGPGSDKKYSILPNATFSTSPSFTMTILDTKEFYSGILSPINMDTINFFWDQGWPKELLLHMFVRKIEFNENNDNYEKIGKELCDLKKENIEECKKCVEIKDDIRNLKKKLEKAKKEEKERTNEIKEKIKKLREELKDYDEYDIEYIENYPKNKPNYEQFQKTITYLIKNRSFKIIEKDSDPEELEPLLSFKTVQNVKHIVNANKEKYIIKKEENRPEIITNKSAVQKESVSQENEDNSEENKSYYKLYKIKPSTFNFTIDMNFDKDIETEDESQKRQVFSISQEKVKKEKVKKKRNNIGTFYLRSPEAMVYYLGEIVNVEIDEHNWKPIIRVGKDNDEQILFKVEKCETISTEHILKVTYDNETYGVRKKNKGIEDQSMHVITLISQLIGLHKSAKDLPKTGTVRLIAP